MARDIERLLAELRACGRLDSTGRFTVDRMLAREKMARYALPDPRLYVLRLLQWTVASGASRVDVTVTRERVALEHDGAPTSLQSARALVSAALPGQSGRALQHLFVGLLTSLRFEPRSILFQSGKSPCWELLADREVSDRGSPDDSTILILDGIRTGRSCRTLRRTLGGEWARVDTEGPMVWLFRDALGFRRCEEGLMRHFCHQATVPIFVNGELVNRPFLGIPVSHHAGRGALDLQIAARRDTPGSAIRFLLSADPGEGALAAPCHRFVQSYTDWHAVRYLGHEPLHSEKPPPGRTWFWSVTANHPYHVFDPTALSLPVVPGLTLHHHPTVRCHAAYYRFSSSVSARLNWVQDGVIVEKETLGGRMRLDVFADASRLATDLGGFSLLRNQAHSEALNWLAYWAP